MLPLPFNVVHSSSSTNLKKVFCEQKEYAGWRLSAWYASGFMCGLLNSAYYVDLSV